MNILENLWYGNLTPNVSKIKNGSKQDRQLKKIITCEEKLTKTLLNEQKELLENLKSAQMEFFCTAEQIAFVKGFKLGAKIMLEVAEE
jgi:hypothetical protein